MVLFFALLYRLLDFKDRKCLLFFDCYKTSLEPKNLMVERTKYMFTCKELVCYRDSLFEIQHVYLIYNTYPEQTMEASTKSLDQDLKTIHGKICRNNMTMTTLSALWDYWNSTVCKRPSYSLINACSMGKEAADAAFARFISEIKLPSGKEFREDSITGILISLKTYYCNYLRLTGKPNTDLMDLFGFKQCVSAFTARKNMVSKYSDNEEDRKSFIELHKLMNLEMILWRKNIFHLGEQSVQSLSNMIFFYLVKIFGFTPRIIYFYLRTNHFSFGVDSYGEFVELNKEFEQDFLRVSKVDEKVENERNGIMLTCNGEKKFRHYNDSSNPRSFYTLLKNYLKVLKSLRSQLMFIETIPVVVDGIFQNNSKDIKLSFETAAMEVQQKEKMLKKLLENTGTQFRYTNRTIHDLGLWVTAVTLIHGMEIDWKKGLSDKEKYCQICKLVDPPSNLDLEVYDMVEKLKVRINKNDQSNEVSNIADSSPKSQTVTLKHVACSQDKNVVHVLPLKSGEILYGGGECCRKEQYLIGELEEKKETEVPIDSDTVKCKLKDKILKINSLLTDGMSKKPESSAKYRKIATKEQEMYNEHISVKKTYPVVQGTLSNTNIDIKKELDDDKQFDETTRVSTSSHHLSYVGFSDIKEELEDDKQIFGTSVSVDTPNDTQVDYSMVEVKVEIEDNEYGS